MNEKIFEHFPMLETERLILRQMKIEDAPKVLEFNASSENLKFVPREPFTTAEQGLEKTRYFIGGFYQRTSLMWTFTLKNDSKADQLIGYGGLFDINIDCGKSEIGYGLLEKYWGRGIVSEAIDKIVEYALNEMQLHRIYAYIDPRNTASIKIVEKLNFNREGLLKDNDFARNQYFDMYVYACINNNV